MKLYDGVDSLKGVGAKKKQAFNAKGIFSLEDLMLFYPRSFEDRRTITDICNLVPGQPALVCGQVLNAGGNAAPYRRSNIFNVSVSDSTGILKIVFFNSYYKSAAFPKGESFIFYGRVTEGLNGTLQMAHPEFCKTGSRDDIRGILPVYPVIEGISQKEMRKYQKEIASLTDNMEEWLPEDIREEERLADLSFALKNLHFPGTGKEYLMAKYRMIFDEFLTMESGLFLMKTENKVREKGPDYRETNMSPFIESLPFKLTKGQKEAWEDIYSDLLKEKPMNRLIQGDVGSGKTVIAEMAMYMAFKNGYQSVMMAPTEILAKQHYMSLQKDFEAHGIRTGLLCSSMKAADRKTTLEKLENGEIDVLVGTHAVIEPGVVFKNMGLVITDEQHRFGVRQRAVLSSKGNNPDVMIMTATPIPRTLAVILYGDSDISQIKTMPEGRKPVKTLSGGKRDRNRIYKHVQEEIDRGHQAYVVAPLIEESEKIDAMSAEELYQELKGRFKNNSVALIHGAMKQEEKDKVMTLFAEGSIQILVSTVVIEVGINVRNATVMVIENCERFGLAQMHQLRGRVGRGDDQSYCYLICHNNSEVAAKRAEILCRSTDGFVISEEDLKLRGPGEIFGTRQHGLPEMIFGDLVRHADVLEKTKNRAKQILKEDPSLSLEKNQGLRRRIIKMFGENISLNL